MMAKINDANDVSFTSGAPVGAFKGAAKNLGNNAYHALKSYWSSTDLKFMHSTSPLHFYEQYFGPNKAAPKEQTYDMILGSLVHCLLLTPGEMNKDFFNMPELNLRTNEGKATRDKLLIDNKGKSPVTEEMLDQATKMVTSCQRNKRAMELLNPGHKELAFFWTCPFSHLNFRAKIDSGSSPLFCELKTTSSAEHAEFSRHAYNMNYDLSIIHYRQGMKSVFDVEPPGHFIVIEREYPYVVQDYPVGESFLETGHQKWLAANSRLADGIQKQRWPGYVPEGMTPPAVEAPPWAVNKMLKEQTA